MREKFKVKNKKSKHKVIFILMFTFVLIISFSVLFFIKAVNPVIINTSKAKIISLSQQTLNNAVFDVIKDGSIYDSLIKISRNESGEITFISNNAYHINKISRDIINEAQEQLSFIGSRGIDIPLGTFSGITALNGFGPNVNIKLIPIGAVNCNFLSKFIQAGINQTNHKIYLEIDCKVNIVLPTENHTVATKTQIMIAENIIIGKSPQTYLYSDEIGELLNLVP